MVIISTGYKGSFENKNKQKKKKLWVIRNMGSNTEVPKSKNLVSSDLRESKLNLQCLGLLICKMEMLIVPTLAELLWPLSEVWL